MKRAKTLSQKQFDNLSAEQQSRELKKLAKRANVRLSLLEESRATNTAYNQALVYNTDQGRNKNRFYEGTRYTNEDERQEAYTAISNLLNNRNSTLKGIQQTVENRYEQLKAQGALDITKVQSMSRYEQEALARTLAKQANDQIKQLKKAGIEHYAIEQADYYNKASGMKTNRFTVNVKKMNEEDLKTHLENEIYFLNSKTSTPEGYNELTVDRINKFRDKGINIPWGKENDFFQFLSSQQFKSLAGYGDSDQLAQTYADARNAGIDVNIINEEFTKFQNDELSLDQVQERLNIAKWQKGGLLH